MHHRGLSLVCALLFSVACLNGQGSARADKNPLPPPLKIQGEEAAHGVYDPSIEYEANGTGWMSYSSVSMPKIETHLARSTDHGGTWRFVQALNTSDDASIAHAGQRIPGVWRHEVSALVYDPQDPGRQWKVFWHRYFTKKPFQGKDKIYAYGWIAHRHAADPGGPWSEEIALFGAGGAPPAPYKAQFDLSSLHRDLQGYRMFTEPGALYKDGVIYLSLDGSRSPSGMGQWKTRKTFLIASKDHGKSWFYVGTLLNYGDSQALGALVLMGSSLFEAKGRVFLMATPSGSRVGKNRHENGAYIFEFADIAQARLKRDRQHRLIPHQYINYTPEGGRGGQGDYDRQNRDGGIVLGLIRRPRPAAILSKSGDSKVFNLINTGKGIKE